MPNPIRNIVLTLALSGCSTMVAHSARDDLIRMSAWDLVTCAGKPDEVMQTRKDVLVAEWLPRSTDTKSSSGMTLSVLGTSMSIVPPNSSCHMQAAIQRDGQVLSVALSSTTGIDGDDGSCAQLVAECVYHPDNTAKDPGYDAFVYFLGTAAASGGRGVGK
jgi:hypothetical protein